ncbi:MAG TPA: cysteine dioxygenase [Stellaceae bacterium]|nr:cysteine dioxygenase [Stellaceae bacterium]
MVDRFDRLRRFLGDLTALTEAGAAEGEILDRGGASLRALVSVDDWLPPEFAQPDPAQYRQYLLYCDPRERFSVVSFVWGPKQRTPVHDHTVWGLIGVLRGAEISQSYTPGAAGLLQPGPVHHLARGEVEAVSPRIGDIHRVENGLADQTSISIHAYGANIGAVARHVYLPENGEIKGFVSGYSNTVLPNIWDRSAETRSLLSI